jgi:hypothetical protein
MRRTSDEYLVEIYGQKLYVPFLSPDKIEDACQRLLDRAGIPCSAAAMPVPVEDILERTLRFHLEFDDDLQNSCNALGATYPESRTVIVDSSLDPSYRPEILGRYRFTIAHEIGHIWLHLPYWEGLSQPLGDLEPPSEIWSSPLECQADMFAAVLLMPSAVVPIVWAQEKDAQRVQRYAGYRASTSYLVGAAARRFEVSRQAMQIRLQNVIGRDVFDEPETHAHIDRFPTKGTGAVREAEQWQRVIFELANLKSLRRAIGDSAPHLDVLLETE